MLVLTSPCNIPWRGHYSSKHVFVLNEKWPLGESLSLPNPRHWPPTPFCTFLTLSLSPFVVFLEHTVGRLCQILAIWSFSVILFSHSMSLYCPTQYSNYSSWYPAVSLPLYISWLHQPACTAQGMLVFFYLLVLTLAYPLPKLSQKQPVMKSHFLQSYNPAHHWKHTLRQQLGPDKR